MERKPTDITISPIFYPLFEAKYAHIDEWYLYGGRDFGKSFTVAIKQLLTALSLSQSGTAGTILSCRSFQSSIQASVLAELKKVFFQYPFFYDYFDVGTNFLKTKNNLINFTFKGTNINPIDLKGVANALLGVLEEADGASEEGITYYEPTLRNEGAKRIYCFNPTSPATDFGKLFLDRLNGLCGRSTEENLYRSFVDKKKRVGVLFGTYKDNMFLSDTSRRQIQRARERMDKEDFDNVYGGKFASAVKGAYYAKKLMGAHEAGHFGMYPFNPLLPVFCAWDLGMNDLTVAVVFQLVWDNDLNDYLIYVLDCVAGNGQPIQYYGELLRSKGYGQAKHYLPHDGAQTRGYTVIETAQDALLRCGYNNVAVIPNRGYGAKLGRIQNTRAIFTQIRFNTDNLAVKNLIDEIGKYAPKITNGVVLDTPDHAHSDYADAFGMIADIYQENKDSHDSTEQRFNVHDYQNKSKWDW